MRGKIVLIEFPYDDFSCLKVRPALCLTDPIGPYNFIVTSFITSKTQDPVLDTDILLKDEYLHYGLQKPSKIQLHRLFSVTRNDVLREVGIVSPELLSSARVKLACLLHI